jgi:NADP-dependent 3-hydroxy acid dehydrogenase YdfG
MSSPVWFISAASSGFGKYLAIEALKNGHRVVATARNAKKIDDLKEKGAITMDLDVIQPFEEIQSIVKEVNAKYGRIDYLINPAGYILEGALEEARYAISLELVKAQTDCLVAPRRSRTPSMSTSSAYST